MAFNLANERIQDTYEQLVQISGSTLVNGIGTAIPAITNINSVSSSYAVSASYADYAVSASYEIVHEVSSSYAETASFADFATSAGTATSATTSTSASHALYADQAGTATSATSANSATTSTTASYIDPTFISASAAAAGFGGGAVDPFPYTGTALIDGEMIITSSAKTDVGVDVSYTAFAPFARTARITPEGFQTLNSTGQSKIKIGGSTDAARISSSYFNTENYSVGAYNYGLWSAGRDGVVIFDKYPSPTIQFALLGDSANYPEPTVYINPRLNVDGTITASGDMLMNNTNGNQTITFTGSQNVVLKGHPDFITTFDESGLFGVDKVSTSILKLDPTDGGGGNYDKSITFINNRLEMRGATQGVGIYGNGTDAAISTVFLVGKNATAARFKDNSVELLPPVTASIISASGGFVGDGFGLTNLPYAGQNKFFDENTYTFDLPGDVNDAAYDIHISQSGLYFISASKQPPYAANGPKVNLYYWPELIQIGETSKVSFFIPNADTGTGISYKENITGSASNQWYWSSTTSPASTSTRNIARNLTYSSIATGTGTTTMIKDASGKVFFVSSTNIINSTNYLYTGDSVNPLT